ncbi:MAG: YggS family pyridoxal phosphate-dependent enzyme [bacterium]|nr:YggS family pyridoxal phosphate-dependent enzyme [bacterium]
MILTTIKQNIDTIRENIEKYAKCNVEIVAVTKGFGVDAIAKAYECGIRHIGENRYQEATKKFEILKDYGYFKDLKLHYLGHLQSNKLKKISKEFDYVQSLDSIEKAKKLKQCGFLGECFIEINLTQDSDRAGVRLEKFFEFFNEVKDIGINITGIMCIAPITEKVEESRKFFSSVRRLYEDVKVLKWLSMGMSDDYIYALMEGANMIRIGRAIFGER